MKVVDLIKHTDKTAFSFEVLPPIKGTGIEKLYQDVDTLREFDPQYINITTHRSEYVYRELGNGLFERARNQGQIYAQRRGYLGANRYSQRTAFG